MTQVIVTGSGGFIGRAVVAQLTQMGSVVRPWTESLDAIARVPTRADAVVHLASTSRHVDAAADLIKDVDLNVSGTEAVLEYCRMSGARCVFASTAGVYRAAGTTPLDENAPVGPENGYATSKLAGEARCRDFSERHGVAVTILRLFNVYGPGQRPPFIVPTVVQALALGEVVQLKMPDAVRDFVFVDDVARAFVAAVERPGEGMRVVNIGSGSGTRVADLVTMVAQLLGRRPSINAATGTFREVEWSVADIRRARAELAWEPDLSLEDGLAAVCKSVGHTRATRR